MNDKNKKIVYLVFYLLFFGYIIFSLSNRESVVKKVIENKEEQKIIVKNYAFSYKINNSIELNGKVYGSKVLTTKMEKGKETIYYQDGDYLYIQKEDHFEKYDGKIVEDIDIRFFDMQFIDLLLEEENRINERTDNTVEVFVSKENLIIKMYFDENEDLDKMVIKKGKDVIEVKYFDIDEVEDFNVLLE